MPAGNPTTKRRLPLLARHAISLGVVFVLALPLSYLGLRYYFQQQDLAQLDQADDAAFQSGLAYIYAHAAERDAVADRATDRIATLPAERGVELHRVLLRAYSDTGNPVPRPVVDAGIALMQRIEMPDAVMVYRHTVDAGVRDDPALLAALDRHFTVKGEARFLQLVEYYDSKAMWSQSKVPADAWLRWLVLLSHSPAETTQRQTARRLGELPDQADAPEIKEALTRLSQSEHPHVRAQVLKSIAGYARIADDPTAYEQILFTLGSDENKVIARRAWLIVGHLNPYSGFSPDWQTADPYVAEAILWAAVRTNPDQIGPALQAAEQAAMLAPAILVLNNANIYLHDDRLDPLFILLEPKLQEYPKQASTYIPAIRVTLAFDPPVERKHRWLATGWHTHLKQRVLSSILAALENGSVHDDADKGIRLLHLATAYRLNTSNVVGMYDRLQPELSQLAAIEGKSLDPARYQPTFEVTDSLAILIGHATGVLQEEQLLKAAIQAIGSKLECITILALTNHSMPLAEEYIRHGNPSEQRCALLSAAILGARPTLIQGNTSRFADFLSSNPEVTSDQLHAMTDAELAEHGLMRVDAIKALLEVAENNPDPAERYETTSLLKLALWMRGDIGDEFTATAERMLLDERLPTSTVLLALLHKQRPIALEYLFGDLVQHAPDLRKLFIQERFWHVFRRFVKTDDLDLWLWGDPAAQDFQLEAMRQWYWVHRFEISDFWISD